jgi:hypothetical protein
MMGRWRDRLEMRKRSEGFSLFLDYFTSSPSLPRRRARPLVHAQSTVYSQPT